MVSVSTRIFYGSSNQEFIEKIKYKFIEFHFKIFIFHIYGGVLSFQSYGDLLPQIESYKNVLSSLLLITLIMK